MGGETQWFTSNTSFQHRFFFLSPEKPHFTGWLSFSQSWHEAVNNNLGHICPTHRIIRVEWKLQILPQEFNPHSISYFRGKEYNAKSALKWHWKTSYPLYQGRSKYFYVSLSPLNLITLQFHPHANLLSSPKLVLVSWFACLCTRYTRKTFKTHWSVKNLTTVLPTKAENEPILDKNTMITIQLSSMRAGLCWPHCQIFLAPKMLPGT